jgi:hypothetical protein
MDAPATGTTPGDGISVEQTLPDEPRSAARARRLVDALEGHAHPETLAKARLLITEIVAAAEAAEPRHQIRVRLATGEGAVRGEVATGRAVANRPKGWGLLLVRRIASRWGMDHGTVWFEVDER